MSAQDVHMHIPIQISTITDTTGHIHPIRFRYRDQKEKTIVTVYVDEVVSYKDTKFDTSISVYASVKEGRRHLIELSYNHFEYKWYLEWIKG